MKKINYFLLLVAALWSTTAVADVVFDETNFPDENFREAIQDAYDEDYGIRINDGDVLTDEILNKQISLGADGYGIHSVDGIEYLAGLISANFSFNRIEYIDLSQNPLIQSIDLSRNPLKSINLSNCRLLEGLTICPWPNDEGLLEGELEELDLSDCSNLQYLQITGEPLINLNTNNLSMLNTILLSELLIENLDLTSCKNLKEVIIQDCNNLTGISFYKPNYNDITELGYGIEHLKIQRAMCLKTLDLSGIVVLYEVICQQCYSLEKIYLNGCSSLNNLEITNCFLKSIEISGCESLEKITIWGNYLTRFDVSELISLKHLSCSYNNLNALELSIINDVAYINNNNNGRQIQVYSTDIEGEKQYFIPLATTAAHKGIKDLIEQENNYEDEDTGFDWADVVTEGITGATLGELDGEQVLWLDPTTTGATEGLHRMTYQYLTHCPNEQYATVEFYLDWAEATTLRGDVNGNDEVDINDVTLLIDVILGKSVEYNATAADCNTASGDGTIDINDVTALINYVLAGNW